MSSEVKNNKEIQIITQLVRETANGNIKWASMAPPKALISATEDEIYTYFEAKYKGKTFAIYERRYKHYYDMDEYSWSRKPVFSILNNEGHVILEFEQRSPVLSDLLHTVSHQVADLDSLLNDLLG
ncbi:MULTISPECIES: hypothetical protein [unclassified Providencia]|uniref:hypothetical protein n=1 Tax=unclassified Providencia TaxID=2633465 RepID=UPI00234B7807|nr:MULTISPECIES: hypothetical protein [unclassified Providencia]